MLSKEQALIKDNNHVMAKIDDIYKSLEQKLGINTLEVRVLGEIYMQGETTQKLICENCRMPKQSVSNVISRLKERGYVKLETSHSDRRSQIVSLTEHGISHADQILRLIDDFNLQILSQMGYDKYAQLHELMIEYCSVAEIKLEKYNESHNTIESAIAK